jgi:crotonobetainyl-CoA:carnitine CoA-transferase CaiB-like acyl-CoA transferase
MAGALEGIKILDCSQIIAGPLAASLLSEMGADVLKVEPLEGEPWRLQAEILPKESRTFLTQNRGKRGLAIDFKNPATNAAREALIRWADVLITNYRPGVPELLKLDYESARALNPSIIYCDNTAFGHEGPDAMRRGYDIVAQAMSGLMMAQGHFRNGQPRPMVIAPADIITGTAMAWAISAALFHRERSGRGQMINTSLLMSALYMQGTFREIVALDGETRQNKLNQIVAARERGATLEEIEAERRAGMPELLGNIYYRIYRTADGDITVGCLGPGPRARFRAAVGIRDPRYEEGYEATPENITRVGAELTARCEEIFRQKTTAEWLAILDANDVAAGPVRFVDELWTDPQVAANGYVAEYEHTLFGALRGPAPRVKMSDSPTRVQRAAPALGEHGDEALREAGLSEPEIAALHEAGAIL